MIGKVGEIFARLWEFSKEIFSQNPLIGLNGFGVIIFAIAAEGESLLEWFYRFVLLLIRAINPTVESSAEPIGGVDGLLLLGVMTLLSLVIAGLFEMKRL